MCYDIDLEHKLLIINQSSLDDITILNSNYTQLVRESTDDSNQYQFLILREVVQLRLSELTNEL